MTTPPFSRTSLEHVVGDVAGVGQMAKALEWLAMTGAFETRRTSSMVSAETCEMSTSMPSRFISRTTRSPNGGQAAVLVARRSRRRPRRASCCGSASCNARRAGQKARSRARLFSIATPPSMPISEAIFPSPTIRSTSSAVRARSNVVGIALDHPVDDVDLLEDRPGRVGVLAGDVDRPELGLRRPPRGAGGCRCGRIQPLGDVELRKPRRRRSAAARAGRYGRRTASPTRGPPGALRDGRRIVGPRRCARRHH